MTALTRQIARRTACLVAVALGLAVAPRPSAGQTAVAPNAEVLQRIADEKSRLATEVRQTTIKLRVDEANGVDAKTLAADRQAQAKAIGEYRQVVAAEVVARAASVPEGGQSQAIADISSAGRAQMRRTRESTTANLPSLVASASAAEKARLYAGQEASLITGRADEEVAAEAGRRMNPIQTSAGFGFYGTGVESANATQLRLRELLDSITSVNVEESRLPSWRLPNGARATAADRQVEEWKRRQQRDADIDEYMRLAEGGLFLDPRTGEVVSGELRDRVAKNAKLELAEALTKKGIPPSSVRTLFGWTDSRTTLAAQIEAEVKANNWYQALDYLNPSMTGAPMPQVFHAMAGVLRKSATEVHDWRAGIIPEGGNGGVTGWLYENFWAKQQVGLRTAVRVGSSELGDIDKRIDEFETQLQAVVDAFNTAANTPDPATLDPATHQLLEQSGFIGKAGGTEFYKVPKAADLTGALQKNLDLPGASMLDMISSANIIKIVLLTAAPQMAAARVGLLLEGLQVGGTGIKLAEVGVELVFNAGATALEQRIKAGTVEWDRIALDTVVMGFAMPVVGAASGQFAEKTAQLFKDPARKKLAEAAVREALGLSSDTVLQTYWQGKAQGTGFSYEELLANAFNSVVGRAAPLAGAGAGGLRDFVAGASKRSRPEWFNQAVSADAEFARLDQARQAELARNVEEAAARVADVVGDTVKSPHELASPENVQKLTEALETGRVKFTDLKMLYQDMPWLFEPAMRGIVDYRARLAEGVLGLGKRAAIKEINGIADQMILDAEALPPAERSAQVAAAEAFRKRELDLANADVKTPGSGNVTSDIDRSIQSEFVRNQVKKMSDAALGRHGGDPATTAQALDLNEYIDVFTIINRQANGARPDGATVATGPGRSMPHADAVEATSLSAAMLHMTPAERARYRENHLKQSNNDPAMIQKLDFAEASLARGERELNAEVARLGKQGLDTTNPDVITRARDNLYGRRTKKLNEMETALEMMDPMSAEASALASQIHLEWAFALREGIETYSDFTGLDVIVQKGQMQKKKVRDMIDDAGFTSAALGITTQQARGMLNDQITMIVEHVNAFNEGVESATQAGSALSKYGERAVLAKKLVGEDVSSGANKELSDITGKLAAVRDQPTKLAEALATFDAGDAGQGIVKLADLIARTMPGMAGVFDPRLLHDPSSPATPPAAGGPFAPLASGNTLLGLTALAREREEERRQLQLDRGSAAVADHIGAEVAAHEAELKKLKADEARDAELAAQFRPQDIAPAKNLISAVSALTLQIDALPWFGMMSNIRTTLEAQRRMYSTSLDNYRRFRRTETAGGAAATSDDQQRRRKRIAQLEIQIPEQKKDQARYAEQGRIEASQRAAGLPADWTPLFVDPNAPAGGFGGFGNGSLLIFPDGTFGVTPFSGGSTFPGLLSPGGSYLIFPPGTVFDVNAPPPPIFIAPPMPLPTGNMIIQPDGAVRFGGVNVSGLTPGAMLPGDGGLTFFPVDPKTAGAGALPGGGGGSSTANAIGSNGSPPNPPPGPPSVLTDEERMKPKKTALAIDGPGTPGTATAFGDRTSLAPITGGLAMGLGDINWDLLDSGKYCCDQSVQPLILHMTDTFIADASPLHPPSLALAARGVVEFVANLLSPRVYAQGARGTGARPTVVVTSLGASQGEAFTLQVVNDTGAPMRLVADGTVVEPLKRQSQQQAQRDLQRALGDRLKRAVTTRIEGYCLSAGLAPPSPGMLFRIAPKAVQEKFRPIRHVLNAADRLAAAGRLRPDSDPKSYFESLKQYATWTKLENWDMKKFGDAWIDRTKKSAAALKQNWTGAMEQALMSAVPGRWRDIQAVLTESAALMNQGAER